MPRYDFESDSGSRVEVRFSYQDDVPSEIEHEGVVYRRVFAAPPVHFACMGFYSTDNLAPIEKWRKENLRGA